MSPGLVPTLPFLCSGSDGNRAHDAMSLTLRSEQGAARRKERGKGKEERGKRKEERNRLQDREEPIHSSSTGPFDPRAVTELRSPAGASERGSSISSLHRPYIVRASSVPGRYLAGYPRACQEAHSGKSRGRLDPYLAKKSMVFLFLNQKASWSEVRDEKGERGSDW